MEIKTMEDALALVPEYWPLTPGVDKWRKGDEFFANGIWLIASDRGTGFQLSEIINFSGPCRRCIPLSVRESEAQLILDGKPSPLIQWVMENRK